MLSCAKSQPADCAPGRPPPSYLEWNLVRLPALRASASFVSISSVSMLEIKTTMSSVEQCSYARGSNLGACKFFLGRLTSVGGSCAAEASSVPLLGPSDMRLLLGVKACDEPVGRGSATTDGAAAASDGGGGDVRGLSSCSVTNSAGASKGSIGGGDREPRFAHGADSIGEDEDGGAWPVAPIGEYCVAASTAT